MLGGILPEHFHEKVGIEGRFGEISNDPNLLCHLSGKSFPFREQGRRNVKSCDMGRYCLDEAKADDMEIRKRVTVYTKYTDSTRGGLTGGYNSVPDARNQGVGYRSRDNDRGSVGGDWE